MGQWFDLVRRVAFGLCVAAVCLFLDPVIAVAQQARPSVYVNYSGDDAVGRRLAYELRTQIAESPLVALADNPDDALLRANLITVAADGENGYTLTAYSYVITLKEFDGGFDRFYTHFAGVCGSTRVRECGRDLLTRVVEVRDEIIAALRES
jgi:hypothetical protein